MNHEPVRVEKCVHGGYGLARRSDGRVILLANSLPGEKVRFHSQGKRKNTLFGTAETIEEPHDQRIRPPCLYYNQCGGCNLQHCSYSCQLDLKTAIVAELLRDQKCPVAPIVPSPEEFGYRQRIRLQVESGRLGYLKFRSSAIIPIATCLIAHPAINRCLADLQTSRVFDSLAEHAQEAELHYNPGTGRVTLLLAYRRKPRPADHRSAVELTRTVDQLERVFFRGAGFALDGPHASAEYDTRWARVLHHRFTIESLDREICMAWEIGGFSQVNLGQNRNIIDYVLRNTPDGCTLLDLFCGMGNFSVPLAVKARELLGAEGQGAGIRSAKRNCETAGITNASFIKGAVEERCRQLLEEGRRFDVTVVDPPRQGIPGLAAAIATMTRMTIVYVSCDPATLARDLEEFGRHGFSVGSIQPFDMFPQTHHIETVAILEKN